MAMQNISCSIKNTWKGDEKMWKKHQSDEVQKVKLLWVVHSTTTTEEASNSIAIISKGKIDRDIFESRVV